MSPNGAPARACRPSPNSGLRERLLRDPASNRKSEDRARFFGSLVSMILTAILSSERISVARGSVEMRTKDDALHALAELLGRGRVGGPSALDFYRVLSEREA